MILIGILDTVIIFVNIGTHNQLIFCKDDFIIQPVHLNLLVH